MPEAYLTSSATSNLSPAKTVLAGYLYVRGPVFLTLGMAFLLGFLNGGPYVAVVCLLASVIPAWLWWHITLPQWEDWAKRNSADLARTCVLAKRSGLFRPKSFLISVTLLALLWIYIRPMTALVYVRVQARKSPAMWAVPMQLPDLPVERSGGRTLSYYGYKFEVPWTELKRERQMESLTLLNFSNGVFLLFLDPAQNPNALELMKQEASKRGTDIRYVFGDEATRSNYALNRKMLYLTPRDVSPISSPRQMMGDSILLILKTIQTANIKGELYSFRTQWLRGFQEGGPARAVVHAYDAQDREVEFWVGADKGANIPSQADINRILYSLRPIDTSRPLPK